MSGISRRTVLKALNGLLLTLASPIAACKAAVSAWFPTRTVESTKFSFDSATGQILWESGDRKETFELVIDGLVESPARLTYAQARDLPRTDQVSDFHCVEGWTIPQVKWSGFRFKEILKLVRPKPEAGYVVFHSLGQTAAKPRSQDHYIESFTLASLMDENQEILLTLDMDGSPLSVDRGAPLRVIAPQKLAYKSAKFVRRIEFVAERAPGWWTLANPIYDWDAPVPQSRLKKQSAF